MLAISRTAEPGRKFFDQLLHLSWERPHSQDAWTAPPGHYLGGEPAFVAEPGNPSGGWIICQLFDGPNEAEIREIRCWSRAVLDSDPRRASE